MADLKNRKMDENMLEQVTGGVDACEDGALYPNGTVVTWKKREWYVVDHHWDLDYTSREEVFCWVYDLEDCRGLGLTGRYVPEHDLVPY